jgi:hypothetical protein
MDLIEIEPSELRPDDFIKPHASSSWGPEFYRVKSVRFRPRRQEWEVKVSGQVKEDDATLFILLGQKVTVRRHPVKPGAEGR